MKIRKRNYSQWKVDNMKVKQIVILMMITSICLFSTEGDDLKKSLQKGECKEY